MSLSPSASPSNPILQGQADSPLGSRLARHFAVGLLAASAPMLSASSAQAGILHAVVNWTVPNTLDGVYINVQTRETASSGSLLTGWDLNPYSDTSLTWFNATGTGMMRYPGVTTGSAGSLAAGTTVGPLASYGVGTVVVGTAPGNWRLNASNYFGFRFIASDGQFHYGWGKFEVGASIAGADRMISEIAWETVANRAVVVGDTGAPPPSYDPCSPSNPSASVGLNTLAMNQTTAADLAVGPCGFVARKANYFRFTAPANGTYTVSTCGMGVDTRLAVLNACGAKASVIACDDNACAPGSRLTFAATASTTYYLVVGGVKADLPSTVSLQVDPPWPTCASPRPAVLGANAFACMPVMANQVASSSTAGGVVRTLYNAAWFEFVPPVTARYRLSLCGASGNTQLAIASSCAASATSTLATLAFDDDGCACADGACGGLPWASVIDDSAGTDKPLANPLVAGTPYLIVIGGFTSTDLPVGTLVIEDAALSYSPCSPFNPTVAEGTNAVAFSSLAADLDLGTCGTAFKANYFKFTPAYSGEYSIGTCGNTTDTSLAVLSDCGPGAAMLACARNTCGVQESLAVTVTAGQAYYIVVGTGTAATAAPASISLAVRAPTDPVCMQATALAMGAQAFTNAASTESRAVKSSADGQTAVIHKARFMTFTPAVTGAYAFSLCGGTGDSQIAIGAGCPALGQRFESVAFNDESCGTMSVLDVNNGGAAGTAFGGFPLTQDLVAGQTYHLVVGSFDSAEAVVASLVVSGPPQGSPADLNHDGAVNAADLAMLLSNWGGTGTGDIDADGTVGPQDLAALLSAWG